MVATLIALVCVLCLLVGLAMGLLVRGARRQEAEPPPVSVAPAPVVVPFPSPMSTTTRIHEVVLADEFLPDGVTPTVIGVHRRTHRIFYNGVAYDHFGQRNGLWTYMRSTGQGVTRH